MNTSTQRHDVAGFGHSFEELPAQLTVIKSGRIKIENILLATDFSPVSQTALPYAAAVARRFDAKLYVAHVVFPELYQVLPPESLSAALDQATKHAKEQMQQLLRSPLLAKLPHEGIVGEGEIWDVLANLVTNAKIDLIVAGTRGRCGIKKLLLGSVAEEIFRLAPCPVLSVGPHSLVTPSDRELRTILYATDFSAHSVSAMQYALSLAQEFQSRLICLHVVQQPGEDPLKRTRLREFFTERLAEPVPADVSVWCKPQYKVEFGSSAGTIVRVAQEQSADLIVMGIWGAGALARATTHIGNTAYRVVSEAHSPVLTIRGSSWETSRK